ncbi:uncharacterized protein [Lolium perenne]|uniref:uncharacterized protein n=1 Tax=Lolium perenne TaxID=4522 RepID=UPI003A9A310E
MTCRREDGAGGLEAARHQGTEVGGDHEDEGSGDGGRQIDRCWSWSPLQRPPAALGGGDHDQAGEPHARSAPSDEVEDHSAYAFHGHTDEVFAAACSPVDASLVVSGGKDDRGFLWRIGSAEDVQELSGHRDTVCTVDFSSDGKLVACGGMDGQINVWNTATRTLQGTLEGSESGFEWLKWHPRCHLIIAGSEDCNIWVWNADHNAFPSIFGSCETRS